MKVQATAPATRPGIRLRALILHLFAGAERGLGFAGAERAGFADLLRLLHVPTHKGASPASRMSFLVGGGKEHKVCATGNPPCLTEHVSHEALHQDTAKQLLEIIPPLEMWG